MRSENAQKNEADEEHTVTMVTVNKSLQMLFDFHSRKHCYT